LLGRIALECAVRRRRERRRRRRKRSLWLSEIALGCV
jgi:hypothetical protein